MKKFVKVFLGLSMSALFSLQSINIFADETPLSTPLAQSSENLQNENEEENYIRISDEILDEAGEVAYLMEIIKRYYVGDVVPSDLYKAAANGILSSLDEYSEFFTKEELGNFLNSIQDVTIGAGFEFFQNEQNYPEVYRVYAGSPADKAGLKLGDNIVKINGKNSMGIDITRVLPNNLEKGDTIELQVLRNEERVDVKISIDEMFMPTVMYCYANEISDLTPATDLRAAKVAYIAIESFGENTDEEFISIINQLNSEGIQDFIIDLRMNGGGVIDSALNMAEIFIPENELLCKMVEKDGTVEVFSETKNVIPHNITIAVDEFSASASELFAGILQQNGAEVVGRNTFGKGVAQTMFDIGADDSFKLTIQEIFLKGDVKLNGVGISPKYTVNTYPYIDGDELIDDPILKKALAIFDYEPKTREDVFKAICEIQEKNKLQVTGNMNRETAEVINYATAMKNFEENKILEKSIWIALEKVKNV